tara:strand:- start:1350 stop:2087 length:738 start_codon:yes stop_codon:yes gene_type:complete
MHLTEKKINNIRKSFEENGYVTLKKFFQKKQIQTVKKNLFRFLDKSKKNYRKRELHFAKNSDLINSVHHLKWPYIKKFKKNYKIRKIVQQLLDEKIKNFGAEVFAKPAKVGMEVPIHQDNFYWNLNNSKGLTVWIALDKCTKKNGALFYFAKSQKIGLLKHKPSYAPGSSQVLKNKRILKKFKKVTPELNEGDVLIHHCLIVHGSKKNTSFKDRAGLTMRYIGRSSKIDKNAKKKYEKVLKKQLN